MAGLLSDAIRYIHSNASVSQLFEMPAREAPIVVQAGDADSCTGEHMAGQRGIQSRLTTSQHPV